MDSQWHRLYTAKIAAPATLLFDLLADLPRYDRWLPYHDGKPDESGSSRERRAFSAMSRPSATTRRSAGSRPG